MPHLSAALTGERLTARQNNQGWRGRERYRDRTTDCVAADNTVELELCFCACVCERHFMFNKYTMEGSISRPVSSGMNSQNLGISDPGRTKMGMALERHLHAAKSPNTHSSNKLTYFLPSTLSSRHLIFIFRPEKTSVDQTGRVNGFVC